MTDDDAPEDNPQRQLRGQVSVLGEKFLQRTRGEAVVLRELVNRLGQGDSSVLVRLQEMAHKIHGSGAMFGFPAVSEHAAEIEDLSERIAAAHTSPASAVDPGALQRLMQRTEQLAQAVEEAARPRHN